MTQGHLLLQAIVAEPDDDLPRLALADWLEEQGDLPAALFIRVQLQLAEIDSLEHDCTGKDADAETTCPACGAYSTACELRERETEVLRLHANAWRERDSILAEEVRNADGWTEWVFGIAYRRGLPAWITCRQPDWLRQGPVLVRRYPLEGVTLSDKRPFESPDNNQCYWRWSDNPDYYEYETRTLKQDLYDVLPCNDDYPHREWNTTQNAIAALSEACLIWARQRLPDE